MGPLAVGPLVLDVAGTELAAHEAAVLQRPHVGGVIFFARNYRDPIQFRALVRSIRAVRSELLLCVDQEGGRVQRFRTGVSRLPAMQAFGHWAASSKSEAERGAKACGWLMAAELRALGVDVSFAPVLDLDDHTSRVIGDRAFSKDPSLATTLAEQFIKGMNEAGMSACAKHFPGHGSVVADSHIDIVTDDRPLDAVEQHDLRPFAALKEVYQAVMPAHVIFPQIAVEPVGFSPYWIQTYLREKLGFEGLVFSDDLSMAAARYAGDVAAAAISALKAGCDAILVCNQPNEALKALAALESLDWPIQNRLNTLRRAAIPWPDENAMLQLHNSLHWQHAKQILSVLEY